MREILYGAGWHERPRLWTVDQHAPRRCSSRSRRAGRCCGWRALVSRSASPPCAMGGTTAPLTLAGLLAVQHAELLAGLVLTQLARPGLPVPVRGHVVGVLHAAAARCCMGAPEYWALMEATVAARVTGSACRCAPAAR